MNPESTRDRKTAWWALLVGAALAVLAGWLLLRPLGDGFARWSYDVPFAWSRWTSGNVPPELVMAYLDTKAKASLGQPADEPLHRRFYPQLLDRLTAEGARVVFFDIIVDSPHADASVDENFAGAIRRNGRVVL